MEGAYRCQSYMPVEEHLLPGWIQTMLRGELWACQIVVHVNRGVTLWIDNQVVVRRIRRMLNGTFHIRPNQKNADLWKHLADLIYCIGVRRVEVQHVYSHQELETLSEAEAQGNSVAQMLLPQPS